MTTTHPNTALLIVGHGSTVNPDSSAPSLAHAAVIRRRGLFARVGCVFWKEEPSFRDAPLLFADDPAIREVLVVPNFISEGYFTQTIIPRELGLAGPETVRADTGQVWRYRPPVGNHLAMTELLLQRAREAAPGVPESESSLLIVGHGTGLNDNSAVAAKQQVAAIAALGRYAAVLSTYMEEPPLIADWATLTDTPNVIVVPFFISDGLHSYQDIPVLLGIETEPTASASERQRQGEVFSQNPRHLHGRALYYASAIGTDPQFADVILEQAATATAPRPGIVVNTSSRPGSEDALAGWLAAGPVRFGQLLLTPATTAPDGIELRHRADTDLPAAQLALHEDPEEAAALSLYDDAGAYRPLKTAPNLRRGWRLVVLDLPALRLALEGFYPARLGAFLAFQQGRLAPTPLRDTLNRQTGMYRVTGKLTDPQADALVARFCRSDGGCLRTILWTRDAAGAPASPQLPRKKFDPAHDQTGGGHDGRGAIPLLCQEACNLLVAEARRVVKGEVPAGGG